MAQECASSCLNTEDKTPSSGTDGLECESLGALSLLTRRRMGCEMLIQLHTHTGGTARRRQEKEGGYIVVLQNERIAVICIHKEEMYLTLHYEKRKCCCDRDLTLEYKHAGISAWMS